MADVVDTVVSPFVDFGDSVNNSLGITKMFDPGKDERARAGALDAQAQQMWMEMLPTHPDGRTKMIHGSDDPMFSLDAPEFGLGPDDMRMYGAMEPVNVAQQDTFQAGGTSAYEGLGVDESATNTQIAAENYFGDLMKSGRDAVAEAEYARRAEQAERARRANTDAAVRSLETQGRGGSGASLLAGLVGAQGEASDRYQAGMDANAIAQARRDAAATQSGTLAHARGNQQLTADTARAQGMDAWDQWEQNTNAEISSKNTDRRAETQQDNVNRQRQISDANTTLQNERAWYQGPGKAEAMWDRQMGIVQGATGQAAQAAQGQREAGAAQPSPFGVVGDIISGYSKMSGGG